MARNTNNYSTDTDSLENYNFDGKYSETGESEYSRESIIPYDQDEVLSVRHYNLDPLENHGRQKIRTREYRDEPNYDLSMRGRGPGGYRRSDDMIKDDVSEALYRSSEVDASLIEVFVQRGFVTLKGSVETRHQKKLAESTIENLVGVEDIYNELRILQEEKPAPPSKQGFMDNIAGMN
jgi:hypothetical protein